MVEYFSDMAVRNVSDSNTRMSLALSSTGDIQLVTGGEKLAEQIIKAMVNDQALNRQVLNSTSNTERSIRALVTGILRNFKKAQIDETNRSDPDFTGYSVFRKSAGTDDQFVRVSDPLVAWKFVDTGLVNNTTYLYGITRIYKKVFESSYVDRLEVTPSAMQSRQELVIGKNSVAIPGSRMVTFYMDSPKTYKASELLDEILSIEVDQDEADPRKWNVNIVVKNLLGEQVALSASSFNLRV